MNNYFLNPSNAETDFLESMLSRMVNEGLQHHLCRIHSEVNLLRVYCCGRKEAKADCTYATHARNLEITSAFLTLLPYT
jgi:hypothetical protein